MDSRHEQNQISFSLSDRTLGDDDEESDSGDLWQDDRRLWMPSQHPHRTLILCFDGTGDEFDADNSNIVQLVAMLRKDDTTQQLVYYQPGIGTYANPIINASIFAGISETLDSMFAINLPTHVKEGYAFLMQNYTKGDKVCIFGFSRGAYTARALAGMLQKIGLLPVHNYQQLPFAYRMYKREDEEGLDLSETFKRTFCRPVHVDFLGVWDTVASVGLIPQYLPFVNENNGIRYLRHALALDERRIRFLPNYCVDPRKKAQTSDRPKHKKSGSYLKSFEDSVNETERATDVKEVWFAGVHCDVGGGSVKNDTPHALSRIPLRWMVRECFRCKTGIIFDAVMLQQIGLNITRNDKDELVLSDVPARITVSPPEHSPEKPGLLMRIFRTAWALIVFPFMHISSWFHMIRFPGSSYKYQRQAIPARRAGNSQDQLKDLHEDYEAEEERKDALSEIYDQLPTRLLWIAMEWLPMRIKKQKAIIAETEGAGGYEWTLNKGRGRKIYKNEMVEGMKVHRSVKTRLEAGHIFDNEVYIPRVRPNIASMLHKKGAQPEMLPYHEWNVDQPQHWEWVE